MKSRTALLFFIWMHRTWAETLPLWSNRCSWFPLPSISEPCIGLVTYRGTRAGTAPAAQRLTIEYMAKTCQFAHKHIQQKCIDIACSHMPEHSHRMGCKCMHFNGLMRVRYYCCELTGCVWAYPGRCVNNSPSNSEVELFITIYNASFPSDACRITVAL